MRGEYTSKESGWQKGKKTKQIGLTMEERTEIHAWMGEYKNRKQKRIFYEYSSVKYEFTSEQILRLVNLHNQPVIK